jgi:ferritin-like metal-binding protein YciE
MATAATNRTGSQTIRSIFVTALRNTHALETEALQIMNRQVERLDRYPEMEQRLRQHIRETEGQQRRIEEALHALGEDRSLLKEAVMSFVGNLAALAHIPAGDEILKNTFANHAFENYEIAAYKSLIAITGAAGESRFVPGFEQSLREEEAMARFISENVDAITRKHLAFEEQGAKADR